MNNTTSKNNILFDWLLVYFSVGIAAWHATNSSYFGYWIAVSLIPNSILIFKRLIVDKTLCKTDSFFQNWKETAQVVFIVSLFSYSSSPDVQLWKVPLCFTDVFRLSSFAGSLFILLFFSFHCASVAIRGTALRWLEITALVLFPYLFNWLLLLLAPNLPAEMLKVASYISVSNMLTDVMVRAFILAVFGSIITVLLGGILTRSWNLGLALIDWIAFAAFICALAPTVANLPSIANKLNLPIIFQFALVLIAAIFSQATLWGQTYLITGLLMDALNGRGPSIASCHLHLKQGASRGAVYGGVFFAILLLCKLIFVNFGYLISYYPLIAGLFLGALLFPLCKTIIESFDGTSPFFIRLAINYRDILNYLRGIVLGLGLSLSILYGGFGLGAYQRSLIGFIIGGFAYAGISILRDCAQIFSKHRTRLQYARVYAVELALGGIVGSAIGWYAEQSQVHVIVDKFSRYTSLRELSPGKHIIYPLFSKWGALDLGDITCGVRLLFNESVSGVIGWSLAAPLFSINLVLLTAILRREKRPIGEFLTPAGFAKVAAEALRVERWGLWMAPIIYSFLRMSGDPTWYNQDGAIRTGVATAMNFWTDDGGFKMWSLWVFMSMLAYDWLRVIIWFDHMGLRVATLVNLSFLGGDLLDEKAAKTMGHAGPTRCIPEGLRRFATWMPLLIPFYIPRGKDWDYAWNTAEKLGKEASLHAYSATSWLCAGFSILGMTFYLLMRTKNKTTYQSKYIDWSNVRKFRLRNAKYILEIDEAGRGWSRVIRSTDLRDEIDLTRRPDSPMSSASRAFYLLSREAQSEIRDVWSLHSSPSCMVGANYTCELLKHNTLCYTCNYKGLSAEAKVTIPARDTIEKWDIVLTNTENKEQTVEFVSFRDLVLRPGGAYERHPNYNDLHIATCFVSKLKTILASNTLITGSGASKLGNQIYFHSLGNLPEGVEFLGYEDSRSAIIGAGTEREPLGLRFNFRTQDDEGLLYAFTPGASLRILAKIPAHSSVTFSMLDGWASKTFEAASLIKHNLDLATLHAHFCEELILEAVKKTRQQKESYYDADSIPWVFAEDGKSVHVYEGTPKPWSHPLSNAEGYGLIANNEGAIFSYCGNAQQNAITPSNLGHRSGVVPGQALYFWDVKRNNYILRLPRRLERKVVDCDTKEHELKSEFGRGYVKYEAKRKDLGFEMTVFILPDKPIEVRLLKLRNHGSDDLKLRMTHCLHFALAEIAADTRGELDVVWDNNLHCFVSRNLKQQFKRGPVFVLPLLDKNVTKGKATSGGIEKIETVYSNYLGVGRNPDRPVFAELDNLSNCEDIANNGFRLAAFSSILDIPQGEELELALIMGQASSVSDIRNYMDDLKIHATNDIVASIASLKCELERTKAWWNDFLGILRIETDRPDFDRLVNDWIPYQLVTSRLWGRTGPQQRSGAFGFRDQLQDVIPLASIHPDISRAQILLHAAQQFLEGDTLQWWHKTWDGKTGLGARNLVSDAMLWLPYVVSKYLSATKDLSILDEKIPYLEGRNIPDGAEGICFVPRVSKEVDSVYEHCKKAINRVLQRIGDNGIPLMGSGDWNDGLDALGRHGKGESVWLGFFLYGVLKDFGKVALERGDEATERQFVEVAGKLNSSLAKMWRNGRFVRATNDAGEELIFDDALTSAWPIINEAIDLSRAEHLLSTGLSALEKEKIVLLLSPAFDASSRPYPGRISLYPPGVRENGGQYSHGSSWLVDAALCIARMYEQTGASNAAHSWRERAWSVWNKISPLTHASVDNWQVYGAEPHQQPADVYYGHGYEGRGGWTWYTGSAGRMLSAAWSLVGIEIRGGNLIVADWAKGDSSIKNKAERPQLKKVVYKGKVLSFE